MLIKMLVFLIATIVGIGDILSLHRGSWYFLSGLAIYGSAPTFRSGTYAFAFLHIVMGICARKYIRERYQWILENLKEERDEDDDTDDYDDLPPEPISPPSGGVIFDKIAVLLQYIDYSLLLFLYLWQFQRNVRQAQSATCAEVIMA